MSALESFCQFISVGFHSCFYDTLFVTIVYSMLSLSLLSFQFNTCIIMVQEGTNQTLHGTMSVQLPYGKRISLVLGR